MQKKIIVYGAGGLGKDIAWQLTELGRKKAEFDIFGFADDEPELAGKNVNGIRVFGGIEWVASYSSTLRTDLSNEGINIVVAIAKPEIKTQKYQELSNIPGISFPTVITDGVKSSEYARFGKGSFILPSCIVSPDAVLGSFVTAHYGCKIGHDSVIGDFSMLYPSVNISGNVHIGIGCEIGTGASIIQGVSIGDNVIIGAGAVVTRNIPANCTAVGVPAKPLQLK